ncbi:MAG: sulfite exporter TauE/SafE family protein, partial [Thermodesulfobacteriota bacterium]|nr:sulfite exporter TauE/SafE family protein [Thermodesulfobacteriota bacterium]
SSSGCSSGHRRWWAPRTAVPARPACAGVLGILFALSFCPLSAALFFGSLFSVALKNESGIILPSVYGIGTALPVLGIAVLMGFSARILARAYDKVAVFEIWARRVTATVFIIAGGYYCLTYLPGAF